MGEIELDTRDLTAPFGLLDGARGLGLPERSVESTPIPSGNGSAFRSQRFDESEVMLPVTVRGRDASEVAELTRRLEHVLVPHRREPVELRIEAPGLSAVRRRSMFYLEGLEGAVGGQESHRAWRHSQLKFIALDPMWYGSERLLTQKVDAARKPFITSAPEPVPTGLRNLFKGSKLSANDVVLNVSGADSVQVSDGLEVSNVDVPESGTLAAVRTSYRVDAVEGIGYSWSIPVRNSGDEPFPVRVEVSVWGTAGYEPLGDEYHVVPPGGSFVFEFENVVPPRNDSAGFKLFYEEGDDVPDSGASLVVQDGVTFVESDTAVTPFNGDTSPRDGVAFRWDGTPGDSESFAVTAKSVSRAPFFPIMVASSTVDGAYQLDIQGDAPAWPIWEVDGPGEDLLIENTSTGDRIFIEGEFDETVTIDTRPTIADIYSGAAPDGELWERVADDYTLFPLEPGRNRIKITMVNANPKTEVRLRYSETWLAGW